MLKTMRTGAQSIVVKVVLFGLLILAMGGLAILDVQGMFSRRSSNATVARVDGARISAAELDRAVDGVLREKNIPRDLAARMGLPQQVLSREIDGRIFTRAAYDAGIVVDDATAAILVREMVKPLATEQKISEKDALARVLASSGMRESAFVGALKQQTATDTLIALLTAGSVPSQQLVDAALSYQAQTRSARYFTLSAADAGTIAPPDDATLRTHYESIAPRFARPAYRAFSVLTLNAAALGLSADAPEQDLQKYYDDHNAEYTSPETRTVAQAIARDEAAARALFDAAKAGRDLSAAASAAKADFIKPRAYTNADMPAELAPAAFAAQAGDILAPVHSALGWHVMQVVKIAPGAVKPFAAVRADISKLISADKAAEALYEQANKIDDLLAGGQTLAEVAATYRLKPQAFPRMDAKGRNEAGKPATEGLPVADKILEQAFRLEKDQASPLIETPSGDLLIVGVTEALPAQDRPFEEARADVLSDWTRQQEAQNVERLATTVAERLKNGEGFDKIAASFRKSPQTTAPLSRDADTSKSGLPRGFMPALFGLEKPQDAASVPTGDNVLVVQLAAIGQQTGGNATQRNRMTADLTRAMQEDIMDQYRTSLMKTYKVKIDNEALAALFRPKPQEE